MNFFNCVTDVLQVHYNIAKLYADEGNVDLAIKKYQLAIR